MPDARLDDGSRLFDHLRGPHATAVAMEDGTTILVRPDGYIASIGSGKTTEYAGQAVKVVRERSTQVLNGDRS